jgi:hypothetical protein
MVWGCVVLLFCFTPVAAAFDRQQTGGRGTGKADLKCPHHLAVRDRRSHCGVVRCDFREQLVMHRGDQTAANAGFAKGEVDTLDGEQHQISRTALDRQVAALLVTEITAFPFGANNAAGGFDADVAAPAADLHVVL